MPAEPFSSLVDKTVVITGGTSGIGLEMVRLLHAGNRLLVAQGHDHPALLKSSLTTGDIYWVAGEPPALPLECHAKTRYRQPDQACTLIDSGQGYRVEFDAPQRAITPGQSVVFYDGERCLGGGIIESAA